MVCIGQIHTRPERERADIARLSCTPYIRSHGDKEDTGKDYRTLHVARSRKGCKSICKYIPIQLYLGGIHICGSISCS